MADNKNLNSVIERFESSEKTLSELPKKALHESTTEAQTVTESLSETFDVTREASVRLEEAAVSSSQAQQQLRQSLAAAEEFLQSTDLTELRSSVDAIRETAGATIEALQDDLRAQREKLEELSARHEVPLEFNNEPSTSWPA